MTQRRSDLDHEHWTAVVILEEKTFITTHTASSASDVAYNQISASLPEGARLVALILGNHASNSFAYSAEDRRGDWTRYVDPFEYTSAGSNSWRGRP